MDRRGAAGLFLLPVTQQRADRGCAQRRVMGVQQRLVTDRLHLAPHALDHVDQHGPVPGILGQILLFVGIVVQVVQFVYTARREDVFPFFVPDDPLRVHEPLAEELGIGLAPLFEVGPSFQKRPQAAALSFGRTVHLGRPADRGSASGTDCPV